VAALAAAYWWVARVEVVEVVEVGYLLAKPQGPAY
jgi:hypothetical protein